MKLAYSTLACPNWSLEQIIDAAQRNGYEGLEFRLLNGDILPADLDNATRNRVKAQCVAAGLKIICVDTSIKIASQDTDGRAAQIRDGIAYLEMAAEWGAPFIRVFGGTPEGTSKADALEVSIECLTALAEHGKDLDVRVLLETHDAFSSSGAVMDVLNQVPNAGALWDTLHPYRVGEQPAETAACLAERCYHVHVKDGRRNGSDKWDLVLLGEGDVPVPGILMTLKSRGYDGWLSVEWEKKWHPEIAEPEIAIPQHADVLRKYLAEVS
ncbi:MAG TPA: sugar phosphate isomerase/epimerase family protein [Aggregatilineales bacterium]|nr:sugar phosphate isomerase/epimerase family protein [Aggregatilineales bacterium]